MSSRALVYLVAVVQDGTEFVTRNPYRNYRAACAYADHLAGCGWQRAVVRTPRGTVLHTAHKEPPSTALAAAFTPPPSPGT